MEEGYSDEFFVAEVGTFGLEGLAAHLLVAEEGADGLLGRVLVLLLLLLPV